METVLHNTWLVALAAVKMLGIFAACAIPVLVAAVGVTAVMSNRKVRR
jgi:hypothetical protein